MHTGSAQKVDRVVFPWHSAPASSARSPQPRSTGWTGCGDETAPSRSSAPPLLPVAPCPSSRPRRRKRGNFLRGPGSIFRVRRCNKKQSSQRGVDRRWHRRPRLVVDDRLSAVSRDRFFIYSWPDRRSLFYRHDLPRLVFVSAGLPIVGLLRVIYNRALLFRKQDQSARARTQCFICFI